MATTDQISQLRLLTAEPDATTYSDIVLSTRIDAVDGDLNRAAYDIWSEKAAGFALLVDVSEGGSTRKMGDLHEQALRMVQHFGGLVPGGEPTGRGTRIRRLRR